MKQFHYSGPKYITFIVTLFCLLNYKVHAQIITTIAGNGSGVYNGDNIPATQAQFLPTAIATDRIGNLFISDLDNSIVRKIDRNGIITTVAGNGVRDFSGDGGLAINATLNYNWGIALDNALNLYIVDDGESRVRKVTINGIINTIAGIDTVNGGGYNGDSILAINAQFDHPSCIALDAVGNIYIADQSRRIRKININGFITTIAGTGVSGYSGDGGLAIIAEIGDPIGITADKTGNIYFTDIDNNIIRKVDKNGIITTVAGNGFAGYTGDGGLAKLATLNYPYGLAVANDGTLYIADTYNNVIRKVDATGIITTVIGDGTAGFSGDGGLATNAKLNLPVALVFDNDNNLMIADYGNARIRKVTSSEIQISIRDKSVIEGNRGRKFLAVPVILSEKPEKIIRVKYTTQKNTAIAGSDYVAQSGILVFPPGLKKIILPIQIKGDQIPEANETFSIVLSDPVNATIADSTAIITISDDDASALSAAQEADKTITAISLSPNPAQDKVKIILTGYSGNVILQLSSNDGRILQQQKLNVASAKLTQLQINVGSYANGTYLVTAIDEKGNRRTERLVVDK